MAANNLPYFSDERLAWYVVVSKLLLGDDVIDWERFKYNNKKIGNLQFQNIPSNILGNKDHSTLPISDGGIWMGPQYYDGKYSDYYEENILKKINIILRKDPNNEKKMGINTFLKGQDQKISPYISQYDKKADGFYFLFRIDWPLINIGYDETNGANDFNILSFEDSPSTKSFPLLQIPTSLLKINSTQLFELLWKEYQIVLGDILSYGNDTTREGPINPSDDTSGFL